MPLPPSPLEAGPFGRFRSVAPTRPADDADPPELQTVVLDAVPGHLALVDERGIIVWVNAAWRRDAQASGCDDMGGVGLDCTSPSATPCFWKGAVQQACDADRSRDGVRDVLAGRVARFAIEYACDSAHGQRWFFFSATRIEFGSHRWAVLMLEDVSARRIAQEQARAALDVQTETLRVQQRIGAATAGLPSVIQTMVDSLHRLTGCTRAFICVLDPSLVVYASDSDPEDILAIPRQHSLTRHTLRTGDFMRCDETIGDSRVDADACRAFGARSLLTAPIACGGAIRGVVVLIGDRPHQFCERDVGTLRILVECLNVLLQRESALDRLKDSEASYRLAFGASPLPMWMVDAETLRFLDVNGAAVAQYGNSEDEFRGMSLLDLAPPEDQVQLRSLLAATPSSAPIGPIPSRHVRRDGTLLDVEITANALPLEGRRSRLVVAVDVTERLRTRDALRATNAMLEERVRYRTADLERARSEAHSANQAKSSFLAAMSHEIRTPMNGVIGMLDVMSQTDLKADQVEMVELARQSATSLLEIIEDILDFSKIEAGKLTVESAPVAVVAVAKNACLMLGHMAAKRGVRVEAFLDPLIPGAVMGDETRIRQILVNLIGNAIKFSGGRDRPGQVSVSVALVQRLGSTAILDMIVADNGIGIAQSTLDLLFTPYLQADASTTRRFGGTGLGLTISDQLARLMGGTIAVRSVPGEGSTFTLRLPCTIIDEAAHGEARAPIMNLPHSGDSAKAQMRGGDFVTPLRSDAFDAVADEREAAPCSPHEPRPAGRVILVAEDNEINRKIILKQLELAGFAAEVAVNGREALERWRSGDFALLLTDLNMPEMDGYALAQAIRNEEVDGRHAPIIALTANAGREKDLDLRAAGIDGYLTKPVRFERLRLVIEAWLGADAACTSPAHASASSPPAAVDVSVLAAFVGDDPIVVEEVLKAFRIGVCACLSIVDRQAAAGSLQDVADACHKLKAAAQSVGARRLGELCVQLELLAQAHKSAELTELLADFRTEIGTVVGFLDRRQPPPNHVA